MSFKTCKTWGPAFLGRSFLFLLLGAFVFGSLGCVSGDQVQNGAFFGERPAEPGSPQPRRSRPPTSSSNVQKKERLYSLMNQRKYPEVIQFFAQEPQLVKEDEEFTEILAKAELGAGGFEPIYNLQAILAGQNDSDPVSELFEGCFAGSISIESLLADPRCLSARLIRNLPSHDSDEFQSGEARILSLYPLDRPVPQGKAALITAVLLYSGIKRMGDLAVELRGMDLEEIEDLSLSTLKDMIGDLVTSYEKLSLAREYLGRFDPRFVETSLKPLLTVGVKRGVDTWLKEVEADLRSNSEWKRMLESKQYGRLARSLSQNGKALTKKWLQRLREILTERS